MIKTQHSYIICTICTYRFVRSRLVTKMNKTNQTLITIAAVLISASLSLTGCVVNTGSDPDGTAYSGSSGGAATTEDTDTRQQLLDMGYTEEMLDATLSGGISLERLLNEANFSKYADSIHNGRPIGASGERIIPDYYSGIYYNDEGVLTVVVLDEAFTHAASATAIAEMLEIGIIVKTAEFTDRELNDAMSMLNQIAEDVTRAGASSWGLDTKGNRVIVRLDPYTDGQKAIFTDLLRETSIDPAMIASEQAVTQEMLDHRAASIAAAARSPGDKIVLHGEVEVSRTGIAFSLENRTDSLFCYGSRWDMAYYVDNNWTPVPHLPGGGGEVWNDILNALQSGGIEQNRHEWSRRFGELPPGRYMFIREGWLGEWNPNIETVYATVEFHITPDSPASLPPQHEEERPVFMNVVEYGNVTPSGMTVVIENTSPYDIEHRAQIDAIVHENDASSGFWYDWRRIPPLPVGGDVIESYIQEKAEGFLPSGGQMEFQIDWSKAYGELPPGEYRIILSSGSKVHPPHPRGGHNDTLVISFKVQAR